MTKSELRIIYKEKRRKLTPQKIDKFNDLILINFQKLNFPHVKCVHTYLASSKLVEVDTTNIVRYLQFKNPELQIAVPKIDVHSNSLYHYEFSENVQLVPNSYGISEPMEGKRIETKDLDVVLVPLLAFDKKGYRVGYGKGYYDKFLADCRLDVMSIGLSYFDPVEEIIDIDEYDLPLNYCITPTRFIRF
ncbi:MAG: 5-formyltetrahydrofolate cyclo-ligase [Ginsengibacter sp.]